MKSLTNIAALGLALVLGAGAASAQSNSPSHQNQTKPQKQQKQTTTQTSDRVSHTSGGVQFYVGPMAIGQVQQKLSAAGFNPGDTDGRWTESTRTAVRQFQQQRGIPATGEIDLHTLAMLGIDLNSVETQSPGRTRSGTQGTPGPQGTQGNRSRENMNNPHPMEGMNSPGQTGSQSKDQANRDMNSKSSQSSRYGSTSGGMGSQTSMTSENEGAPLYAGPTIMQQVIQKLGQQRYGSSDKADKSSKNYKDNKNEPTTPGLSSMSSSTEIRQVLTKFQRAKGIPASGELTFETLDKLGIDLNSIAKPEHNDNMGNTGRTGTYGSQPQGNTGSPGDQSTNQAYDQSRGGTNPNNPSGSSTPSSRSSGTNRYGTEQPGQTGTSFDTAEGSMSMPIYVGTGMVRKVQEALKKSGQNVGPANGQWNSETHRALSDFQQAKGLPVTGNFNLETLHALGVADNLNDLAKK